jgi:hypothetical protein
MPPVSTAWNVVINSYSEKVSSIQNGHPEPVEESNFGHMLGLTHSLRHKMIRPCQSRAKKRNRHCQKNRACERSQLHCKNAVSAMQCCTVAIPGPFPSPGGSSHRILFEFRLFVGNKHTWYRSNHPPVTRPPIVTAAGKRNVWIGAVQLPVSSTSGEYGGAAMRNVFYNGSIFLIKGSNHARNLSFSWNNHLYAL